MGGIIEKIKKWLICVWMLTLIMTTFMVFLTILKKYDTNHYKAKAAQNDMIAAQYRMQTEQYKSETARLNLELSEAKLRAFIRAYNREEDK